VVPVNLIVVLRVCGECQQPGGCFAAELFPQ
jgi:hypothetical protein